MSLKLFKKSKLLKIILVNSQIFNFLWLLYHLLSKQLNMRTNVKLDLSNKY